jgi:diadenosine tetraphosphate (Ap4A) HIT family hydrolase
MSESSAIFRRLSDFIQNEMRMSHVYQPVMLRTLLTHRGEASVREIAKALLSEDQSQIEYYEQITKRMVGKVLTTNRGITTKTRDAYSLNGFSELSKGEQDELVALCDGKIAEFLDRRSDPWSHRRQTDGYVPGTLRYEVLKRARFRCELCGISAEEKALEVDHIIPRNHGGVDDAFNLQALCYSCNATKRDRDDTDFRGVAERYEDRVPGCIFCEMPLERIIGENRLSFAIGDGHPVTGLHTLVIPKRHVADFFDLFQPERNAVLSLIDVMRLEIQKADPTVTGFNVGANAGKDAGQTVFHCHVHLIPRRSGDMADPRGGVRGVIPDRQSY